MSLKAPLVKLFRSMGWQLSSQGLVRLDAPDGYMVCPPNGYRVYAPWTREPFRSLYERIREWTVVSDDRCYILHQFARHAANLPTAGDFAECGVYKGGTAMLTAHTMQECGAFGGASPRHLHLFDTFEGMPEDANRDPGGHVRGDFNDTSVQAVQSRLKDYPKVRCHPGYIPSTLEAVKDRTFAYVYLDLDLHQGTRDGLEFFYPRMVPGAVFIGDDYGFPRYKDAAKKAVDEFFADKPEPVVVLKTGQCLVIKL